MTTLKKAALLAALVTGIGTAAVAGAHGPGWGMGGGQGPGYGPGGCAQGAGMMQGMGPGWHHGWGPGMMHGGPGWSGATPEDIGNFQDQRLSGLKDQLKITPEQETAWNAFATQWKEHRPARMGPPTGATGPDWFAARTERMKERVAAMEKMQGAYKQLYDVLTPAQREVLGSGFGPRWGWRAS